MDQNNEERKLEIAETNEKLVRTNKTVIQVREELQNKINDIQNESKTVIEEIQQETVGKYEKIKQEAVSYTHLDVYKRQPTGLYQIQKSR